jgi:hypothetical protein
MGTIGVRKFPLVIFVGLAGSLLCGCASQPNPPPETPKQTAQLDKFDSCAVKQHTEVWCWAACAEMIHRYYGQPMTQEEIVARIMQRSANDPDAVAAADKQEVLGALDTDLFEYLKARDYSKPTWEQKLSKTGQLRLGISVKDLLTMPQEPHLGYDANHLAASVQEQHAPVILALKPLADGDPGHIVVIHQVVFQDSGSNSGSDVASAVEGEVATVAGQAFGNFLGAPAQQHQAAQPTHSSHSYAVVQATYMDPDTGKDTVITGTELATRADFIASKSDADAYLKYLKAFEVWQLDIENGNNAGAQGGAISSGYTMGKKN